MPLPLIPILLWAGKAVGAGLATELLLRGVEKAAPVVWRSVSRVVTPAVIEEDDDEDEDEDDEEEDE